MDELIAFLRAHWDEEEADARLGLPAEGGDDAEGAAQPRYTIPTL
ncbi:hypothetical protein ACQPYK_30015 [Streptosporangium sp. CA-135522]